MPEQTILIVEDDADIVDIVRFNLSREGYRIEVAVDGLAGLEAVRKIKPDLLLLDLMLPKLDGLELCRQMKQGPDTANIPIIMLTAKGEESDIIVGLNMGADDYMIKPFSPKELNARIKAVLRRAVGVTEAAPTYKVVKTGELVVDANKFEATLAGKVLTLTRSQFRLLFTLAGNPGRVFTRDHLLDRVRGADVTIVDRNIDVHIAALRKMLGKCADYIITVRGIGYRFKEL